MTVTCIDSTTTGARPSGADLIDALQEWRDAAWTASSECHVPEQRAIDAHRATVERARRALMRRHGMDTFQAFALLVRRARQAHTPVHAFARTLAQDVDEAGPQPDGRSASVP